jgi:L-rhamnose mutarotase
MKPAKTAGKNTSKSRKKASKQEPLRCAFTLRLKLGAFDEYVRYHDAVWPELVREIERCGIAQITTFENEGQLFLYSEIYNPKAWEKLWNSKIHDRWSECMKPLMLFKADGKLDSGPLRRIFHLKTNAGKKRTRATKSRGTGRRNRNLG